MGRRVRHGPRFSGGGIETVRGTGYIPHFDKWEMHRPKSDTFLESRQKSSLSHRKAKGIEPSMPRFNCIDGPEPPPPPEPPKPDFLAIAERIYRKQCCKALAVLSHHGHHVVISMMDGKEPFTICLNAHNRRVLWTEGKAPYVQRNGGAGQRKER